MVGKSFCVFPKTYTLNGNNNVVKRAVALIREKPHKHNFDKARKRERERDGIILQI